MKVTATRRIPRPGQDALKAGEVFETSETRAQHLITIGWATAEGLPAAAPASKPAKAAPAAKAAPKAKAPKRKRKPLAVGDLVQVEIGGALQLPEAQPVTKISRLGGETWVHVGDNAAAVSLEQIVRS